MFIGPNIDMRNWNWWMDGRTERNS